MNAFHKKEDDTIEKSFSQGEKKAAGLTNLVREIINI